MEAECSLLWAREHISTVICFVLSLFLSYLFGSIVLFPAFPLTLVFPQTETNFRTLYKY